MVIVKVVPVSGELVSSMVPLWRWTMDSAMAKPNPTPPSSRDRALSTRKKRSNIDI